MTITALPDSRPQINPRRLGDPDSLQMWLAERWAILFSHPDDFAQEQMEMDRWVSVLSRSFCGRSLAPVGLATDGREPQQGWLGALAALDPGCAAVLSLDPPAAANAADTFVASFRARIAGCGPRFAMILDSDLRCRRALSYRLPAVLPSPLDLIGWAVALRKRDRAAELRREMPESPPVTSSAWVRTSRCAGARRP